MSWVREEVSSPVLDRKLELQDLALASDGAGGWSKSWTTLGAIWAAVRARSGREIEQGAQGRSRVSHRILVRAAPPGSAARPRADQRFKDGGRVFLIRAVTEADARGRYLLCWADEEAVR
ncbi:head-tail adaptor protein [Rhodovulum sp. DZ06]|uniref:head-tail adaptor protein n=1 Tax=Rhodovulum sp. DZ06 TaxID=3425126 RepID=UPI003D34030F